MIFSSHLGIDNLSYCCAEYIVKFEEETLIFVMAVVSDYLVYIVEVAFL